MKVVDLKKEKNFIKQYVLLRNSYIKQLLTSPVSFFETIHWIKRNNVELRGIIKGNNLLGVVILYVNRGGEIAFFVRYLNKGVGNRLLRVIERVAKQRGLKMIWAWALKDNFIAQRVFEKNNFIKEDIIKKQYKGELKHGIKYIKSIKGAIDDKRTCSK